MPSRRVEARSAFQGEQGQNSGSNWQTLPIDELYVCSTETLIDWFWGPEIVRGSVGIRGAIRNQNSRYISIMFVLTPVRMYHGSTENWPYQLINHENIFRTGCICKKRQTMNKVQNDRRFLKKECIESLVTIYKVGVFCIWCLLVYEEQNKKIKEECRLNWDWRKFRLKKKCYFCDRMH